MHHPCHWMPPDAFKDISIPNDVDFIVCSSGLICIANAGGFAGELFLPSHFLWKMLTGLFFSEHGKLRACKYHPARCLAEAGLAESPLPGH